MKTPAPPPVSASPDTFAAKLGAIFTAGLAPWTVDVKGEYLAWKTFRFKTPPEGISVEDWWFVVRMARRTNARQLQTLVDKAGRPFNYSLPDEVLRATEEIARDASGQIAISELVTNPDSRARYLVNSLIEEAITSSQLEGAATSRRDAKDLLRTKRKPKDNSESMILNNYLAMERVREVADQPLTPGLVMELHRIVTDGTLDDPGSAGRLQENQAFRVAVWDGDQLLHRPPPVEELEARLQALCDFANDTSGGPYMPPVLRALTHFFIYHLGVIQRAIADLHVYLEDKAAEVRDVQSRLKGLPGEFNYRQLAVIDHATRNPFAVYTVASHGASHRVSAETARQDLHALEERELLERFKVSKRYMWRPVENLSSKL